MPDLTQLVNQLVDRFDVEINERGIDNLDDAAKLITELVAETGLLEGSAERTCVAATLSAIAVRNFKSKSASLSMS